MPKSAVSETYHYLYGLFGRQTAPSRRGLDAHLRDTLIPRRTRETFLAAVRTAADRGLMVGTLSEASMRLGKDKFILTARECRAATITENDLKVAAFHDHWVTERETLPQFEGFHRLLYRKTTAGAALLVQPAAALAMAARRAAPSPHLLIAAAADIGELIIYEIDWHQDTPDTVWPADPALETFLSDRSALLLPGYGLLTWGEDLNQAIARAETIDRWCEIALKYDSYE